MTDALVHAAAELRRIAETGSLEPGSKDWATLYRISGLLAGAAEGAALADETRRAEREAAWDAGFIEGELAARGHEHDKNPHRKTGP